MVSGFDFGNVGVPLVKGSGRHHNHRHIHETCEREGNDHLTIGESQQLTPPLLGPDRRAILREAGVQINGMWHDRGAENPRRDRQSLA